MKRNQSKQVGYDQKWINIDGTYRRHLFMKPPNIFIPYTSKHPPPKVPATHGIQVSLISNFIMKNQSNWKRKILKEQKKEEYASMFSTKTKLSRTRKTTQQELLSVVNVHLTGSKHSFPMENYRKQFETLKKTPWSIRYQLHAQDVDILSKKWN